jgi:hypothetical protein
MFRGITVPVRNSAMFRTGMTSSGDNWAALDYPNLEFTRSMHEVDPVLCDRNH